MELCGRLCALKRPIHDCLLNHLMLSRRTLILLNFHVIFLAAVPAAEWPEFRGPTGQGHSNSTGLPVTWSESDNIVWKAPVPGHGWSSPVILGDQIWMTTATENGRSLRAVALSLTDGRLLRNVEVFQVAKPPDVHYRNNYASPTPVLEGDRIYVHFGPSGTAALDHSGRILWKTEELTYKDEHGPGSSPVLFGDLLIVNCDGRGTPFVAAVDKNTGKVRWKTTRHDGARNAFTTPLVIPAAGGEQLISPGADRAVAYDPKTGRELWWIRYNSFSLVPRPVFGHGLVYIVTGAYEPVLYAIRPDGNGDVTKTHVVWTLNRGIPYTPSPLLVGDEIYVVNDNGLLTCLDARSGQTLWRTRLGGNYLASPLYADGKIYVLSDGGQTTVLQPGRTFLRLSQNQVDGITVASMAVAGKSIFIRSESHLYRIETQVR